MRAGVSLADGSDVAERGARVTEEVRWRKTPHGRGDRQNDITEAGVKLDHTSDHFVESLVEAIRDALEDEHGGALEGARALRFALNQHDMTRR